MTSPAGNTEPTAEQVEAAWQAVRPDYTEVERRWTTLAQRVQVDRVARALAAAVTAEREKYLRVADELDEFATEMDEQGAATVELRSNNIGWGSASRSAARRIREVAG